MQHTEKLNTADNQSASVAGNVSAKEEMVVVGKYTVECVGADGKVKWTEIFDNLVTNAGKVDLLTQYFKGSAYTAAWYLSLVNGAITPTYNATDTMASHGGWTEFTSYGAGTNRATPSFGSATATGGGSGTAGTGSIVTTATAFSITGSGTVAGAFLTNTQALSPGTTGTLFSAGSFTGGNRSVVSTDTLNVTYTASC
jgi:hypothetical protein